MIDHSCWSPLPFPFLHLPRRLVPIIWRLGKKLSEAWKSSRILRLQSRVNVIICGTMLAKLSTFHVPKVEGKRPLEVGEIRLNSGGTRSWEVTEAARLVVCTRGIWRGNRSVLKTHHYNAENSGWVNFIYLAGTFSSISWIGRYNCLKIKTWRHVLSHRSLGLCACGTIDNPGSWEVA